MTNHAHNSMDFAAGRRGGGFTLIEMLVVIGIIALLVSVIVVGGVGWINRAKEQQTKLTLSSLDTIMDEYHTEMNRYLPVQVANPKQSGTSNNPTVVALYDPDVVTLQYRMTALLDEVQEVGEIFKIVGGLKNETWTHVGDEEGGKQVLDGWGNPIMVVFKRDEYEEMRNGDASLDDPLNTNNQKYRPWFVSPGEDGEFGKPRLSSGRSKAQERAAEDNLFSDGSPNTHYFNYRDDESVTPLIRKHVH